MTKIINSIYDDVLSSSISITSGTNIIGDTNSWLSNGVLGAMGTDAYTITSGSSGLSWHDLNTNITTSGTSTPSIHVKGAAIFDDDITLQGRSLGDTLKKIEDRLNILRPNAEVESRWEELRELGEKYKALEADILSKENLITMLTK